MKKTIALIFLSTVLFILSSCANSINLLNYVSEFRTRYYEGVQDGYKVTVYCEERETPFFTDGYVGEMKNYLIVRLEKDGESVNNCNVFISYDDVIFDGCFTYNPINGKYTVELEVEKLPTANELKVELLGDNVKVDMTVSLCVLDNVISAEDALKCVQKYDESTISSLFKKGAQPCEIRVRILGGDGRNYYYVGFCTGDKKTVAYLVDGILGEVLAKRSLQ